LKVIEIAQTQQTPYRLRHPSASGVSTPSFRVNPAHFLSSTSSPPAAVLMDVDHGVVSLVKQRARRVQARTSIALEAREGHMPLPRAVTLRATVAESAAQIEAAKHLMRRRYAWRGYDMPEEEENSVCEAFSADSSQVVFVATSGDTTVGTITLGLDRPSGLLAESSYGEEIEAHRAAGRQVCEVTRLAVAEDADSKRVLAALFSLTWAAASVNGVTDMFVEVNPRHVVFYRRILGFTVAAEERFCERVRAPSVLLRVDMDDLEERLTRMNERVAAQELQAEAA